MCYCHMRVLSSCTVFTKCFIVFACCKLGSNKMYLILFETNLAGDYSIIQYSTVLFLSLQGIDDLRTAVLKSELEMLSHAFISLVLSFEASTYIIKLLHPYFPSQVLRISDQGLLLILCTHLKSSLAKKKHFGTTDHSHFAPLAHLVRQAFEQSLCFVLCCFGFHWCIYKTLCDCSLF